MKTVAIYCDSLELPGATFENDFYWEAYADMLLLLKARGLDAYFVSGNATYLGSGVFTKGYTLREKTDITGLIRVPFVRADIVFDRGAFKGTDVPVLNPPEVRQLGYDKITMFEQLGKYQAPSAVAHNRAELEQALATLKTDKVVVKDPVSAGGRGVFIGSREEVLAKVPTGRYPLLAQEFMDTSVGVPGQAKGVHDLRIEMGGGDIWTCYLRIPKKGELRANVAQGGTARYLPYDQTPPEVADLARKIDSRFGKQPRFYALDFANTPDGWKLIELNSQPGLVPVSNNEHVAFTMNKLADYITRLARQTRTSPWRQALALPASAARFAAEEYEKAMGEATPKHRPRLYPGM
ncbi:MAG TPA: ATP-grasp domain-containing protein [Candidatus Saccharimonadales bacterium]|nr:ATP-grasp domain-containing protein [Candidatus Saccharimonadales bacterium]